ncbi:DUF2167 domain-containing protein [Dyella sp.]|uniref:DUF2167 domain-containing protein n=1 Tax=Dyella sp. TaxID=1869338 RepID=UPI002ED12747
MTSKSFLATFGLLAAFAFSPMVHADNAASDNDDAKVEAFLKTLHPKTGTIAIPQAQATLNLGPNYSYLEADDAQRVVHDLWDNPPDKDILGMILPSKDTKSLLDDKAWAVVVTYSDDGYVSDEDATKIDYGSMLKDMQDAAREENPERQKQGYSAIELVGWAEPPRYDSSTHKLYWARDLKFTGADGKDEGHTLNYAIRVLGRHGYLSLNAVAPISQLAQVRADMPDVVAMADFDQGNRYTDFNSSTDKLAAYGIGALVAGGIAAKAGLFAKLGALLLAAKKLIIVGIAAIGALFRKIFQRNKAN